MRRLFNEHGDYTDEAFDIDNEARVALSDVMAMHPDVDIRDLESIINGAAVSAALEMILDRKAK